MPTILTSFLAKMAAAVAITVPAVVIPVGTFSKAVVVERDPKNSRAMRARLQLIASALDPRTRFDVSNDLTLTQGGGARQSWTTQVDVLQSNSDTGITQKCGPITFQTTCIYGNIAVPDLGAQIERAYGIHSGVWHTKDDGTSYTGAGLALAEMQLLLVARHAE